MAQDSVLTGRQARAAELVALDRDTDAAIAATLGIGRRTLERWKQIPAFRAAVAAAVAAQRQAVRERGVAERQNRLDTLNDAWTKLQQVIAERAADPLVQDAPGGRTGLVVATPLLVKVYQVDEREDLDQDEGSVAPIRETRIVYTYAVDTGLLKELRELAKLARVETGQSAVLKHLDLGALTTEQLERIADGADPVQVLLGR